MLPSRGGWAGIVWPWAWRHKRTEAGHEYTKIRAGASWSGTGQRSNSTRRHGRATVRGHGSVSFAQELESELSTAAGVGSEREDDQVRYVRAVQLHALLWCRYKATSALRGRR